MDSITRGHVVSLPPELITKCLIYVDGDELSSCKLVCKLFCAVVESSVQLRYNIELAADGFIDGPSCSLATTDRLDMLLERRRRWLHLDWSQTLSARDRSRTATPMRCYDMVQGLLIERISQRQLLLTSLPSHANPTLKLAERSVEHIVANFAVDPSQDLLVLLDAEGCVRLRTLSSNSVHPLAQLGTLPGRLTNLSFESLQIAGDLVGLFSPRSEYTLRIWNWHTGSIILEEHESSLIFVPTSFIFLSSRVLLLSDKPNSGSLVLFAFTDAQVVSTTPLTFSTFHPVAILNLPLVRDKYIIGNMSLGIAPLLAGVIPGVPFATSPAERIIVMQLSYLASNRRQISGAFSGFVHCRYLLSFVSSSLDGQIQARVVPWDEWGPKNTRIAMLPVYGNTFERYTSGQRVVLRSSVVNSVARHIYVLDFNVHPRHLSAMIHDDAGGPSYEPHTDRYGNRGGKGKLTLVREPARLRGAPFKQDVVTSLPYVQSSRGMNSFENNGYMIDEERLIEVKFGTFNDNVEGINVHVF
ncbi:hypothetical protein BKA93DRAFT_143960 [Sparassis latifolia]